MGVCTFINSMFSATGKTQRKTKSVFFFTMEKYEHLQQDIKQQLTELMIFC